MNDSDRKLRHLPFFEEVAALDENSDAWKSATAGLLTLRLVDSWLESGAGNASDDEWNFKSVCAAVDNVSERSPMQALLSSVLFAMREGKPSVRPLIPALMAYAKALEWDAKFDLAVDVYQTLLSHLHPTEDSEACVAAQLRLGVVYRSRSQMDQALAAFGAAFEIGNSTGDLVAMLRARVGEAEVTMWRGNLPDAATKFDSLIESATAAGLRHEQAMALMGRAGVAQLSQQYDLAIRLGYEALKHQEVPSERDRILSNIAGAFYSLGVYSAARDAYLVLSVTAREQYLRWAAMINLMELSIATGAEMHFQQYRREMLDQKLPAQLETAYHLTSGTGLQKFGDLDGAQIQLAQAVGLARGFGLNQYLHEAESALANLQTPAPPSRRPVGVPAGVEEVALAIKQLRELAEAT